MSDDAPRKRSINALNIFNVTNNLVPIYFNEKISFQKPIKDKETIIKVIEIEVFAKPRTKSFQVD